MAKFKIVGINSSQWETEADKYTVESGFFHFYDIDGEQVFAVKADLVKWIRADEAANA